MDSDDDSGDDATFKPKKEVGGYDFFNDMVSIWDSSRVSDPYSFFTDPDPDPVDPDGGQYGSGYGSGSNPDPGL